MLWIGLMSGTSADAVDAALVRIGDQPSDLELVEFIEEPLPAELATQVREFSARKVLLRELLELNRSLAERFAGAATRLLEQAGVDPAEVEGIGSHGQTVAHHPEPPARGSLQLADPAVISQQTGIPVVSDFRSADLAAGGQGAPLTPFFHCVAFAASAPCAVLNIGGFTNVSYMGEGPESTIIGFDPGPGNALLDRAAQFASEGGARYDSDGSIAASGQVQESALESLLQDDYFSRPPPKSTGHEHFGAAFLAHARELVEAAGGGAADLQATLAELTVQSVVRSARFAPVPPEVWIVYGGGVRNLDLMRRLARAVEPRPCRTSDELGVPTDALEAMTFALLGWCAAHGQPSNLPEVTGATQALVLGSVTPPNAFSNRP